MTAVKATTKRHAKYWKYTGNHINGKDCERANSYGYSMWLISFMAYVGDGGDYQEPLTYEMTKQISVKHLKGDSFGHEVEVAAPKEVWAAGREAWKRGMLLLMDVPEGCLTTWDDDREEWIIE